MSISHKKASIEVIEKAWQKNIENLLEELLSYPNISECAALFTCNRIEIYVAGFETLKTLQQFSCNFCIKKDYIEYLSGDECLRHLLRVSSGLESMIIGEDQILGQVKESYHFAKTRGWIGEFLDVVFSKAIQTGKKVRRLTDINRGSVSIGSAAVELAEDVLGSLEDKKVLIVGAGKMGGLVAKAIKSKRVSTTILISSRKYKRAEELAKEIGGIATKFSSLKECMEASDVVISATSAPHYVIRREMIEKVMKKKRDLLIIDIAVPRDVEESVREIRGVELYTIDDLKSVSERNLMKRVDKIPLAEKIIEDELNKLKNKIEEIKIKRTIALMYTSAEKVKKEEIKELYNKLSRKYSIDESILPVLEDFINSFIKKYLRTPTIKLKTAVRDGNVDIINAVEYLFRE